MLLRISDEKEVLESIAWLVAGKGELIPQLGVVVSVIGFQYTDFLGTTVDH